MSPRQATRRQPWGPGCNDPAGPPGQGQDRISGRQTGGQRPRSPAGRAPHRGQRPAGQACPQAGGCSRTGSVRGKGGHGRGLQWQRDPGSVSPNTENSPRAQRRAGVSSTKGSVPLRPHPLKGRARGKPPDRTVGPRPSWPRGSPRDLAHHLGSRRGQRRARPQRRPQEAGASSGPAHPGRAVGAAAASLPAQSSGTRCFPRSQAAHGISGKPSWSPA